MVESNAASEATWYEWVTAFLGDDPAIKAIANLGALIGVVILLYHAGKWTCRFIATAYKTNIRTAVMRERGEWLRGARNCAQDSHIYISAVTMRIFLLFISLMLLVLLDGMQLRQHIGNNWLSLDPPDREMMRSIYKVVASWGVLITGAVIMGTGLEGGYFISTVVRFRLKRLKRRAGRAI